jgi:hemerythrin
MAWDNALNTGIEKIDAQHKALIEKVDEFLEACTHNEGQHQLESMLNFLISYTERHFSDEMELQELSGYTNARAHKELHMDFVVDLTDLKEHVHNAGICGDVINSAKSLLLGWLIDHISHEDMEFAKFYTRR